MAYERVHSEATSNARRAREGGRRREKEGEGGRERERGGEREREAPLRGLDHPRTIDAREKWSLQRR